PEVLRGEEYTHSVDWWSLGIIVYSLLTGQYPVSGYDDHITMGLAVARHDYRAPEGASRAMQGAVMGLLHRDPLTRTHSLHQLQREELFRGYDFDMVREKLVWPRRLLEEHIDNRTRRSFHEFGGLTSTPKKKMVGGGGGGVGGRLGHHDSLVKSVSSGAAVPLLQSPLLRLARGQAGHPPRRACSQGAVSARALPTAVSPLLVNVRGPHRWGGGASGGGGGSECGSGGHQSTTTTTTNTTSTTTTTA
ncbi:hypothetical protein Pcinc_033963, partial [Petrolisthes cinctipes]